jgi:hypothetical protein
VDEAVYSQFGGFATEPVSYVPLFVVVGYQRKVYWDGNSSDFRAALRQAIDEMPPATGVYVQNVLSDKQYQLGATLENIDLTNTFKSVECADPIIETIVSNSDPSVVSASISGNTLTLKVSSYNPGTVTIKVKGTDQNNAYAEDTFTVYVYNTVDKTVEDFNDGSYTAPAYTWTTTNSGSGAKNWVTTTTSPQEGAYCAGTDAALKDNQWCAITTTANYSAAGKITFWGKTSTEPGYDFLNFYIDGVFVDGWSGTTAWTKYEYPVSTSGNHTFKFEYSKDEAADGGTDQVWVDYIEFFNNATPVTPPTPVLASPANGTTSSSGTPTFDWNDVSGSTLYDLLVDNNSDFSSPEVNVTAVPSSYTVPTKALSAGTYYWKVKVTSAGGSYSTPWTYTVGSTVIPGVPANLTTSIVSGNVYINWNNAADATSYDVYSSATPYGTFSLLTNVTASEYTYTGVESNAKMFFYIVSKNGTKESPKTIEVK